MIAEEKDFTASFSESDFVVNNVCSFSNDSEEKNGNENENPNPDDDYNNCSNPNKKSEELTFEFEECKIQTKETFSPDFI